MVGHHQPPIRLLTWGGEGYLSMFELGQKAATSLDEVAADYLFIYLYMYLFISLFILLIY